MSGFVRRSGKGRALALAAGLVCGSGSFAQETSPGPDPEPPWLGRILQTLERVEEDQRALRQEIETFRVQRNSALTQGSDFTETEREPSVENDSEAMRLLDSLARLEAEQQALRAELEDLLDGEGSSADMEVDASALVGEESLESENERASAFPNDPPRSEVGGASFTPSLSDPSAKLYERGREAFRNLNFYDAIQVFREFLTKYPAHEDAGEARYWLAEALYVEGRFQDAIAVFGEVISDDASPRREVARLKTGYAWFELGDFERAEAILVDVRDQNAGSDLARLARARLERMRRQEN